MINAVRHVKDEVTGRELFGLHLERPDLLNLVHLSSKYFACLLAWDSTNATTEVPCQ
jgi:hypothetical protein